MMMIKHRSIIVLALALTLVASSLAMVTRCVPSEEGCEGALCALVCDEDDASALACPRPLACVGDRCELQVETCSKDGPVDACVCSPPWVVREGRCIDPFVNRVCAKPGAARSAVHFAETCEGSPSRCSQLLRLDGGLLRSILESAPVRSTQPWDSTIAGLPRVDRWLAEHETSSLYGGEAFVIAVAAPSPPARRSRARRVSPRAVSEAMQALVGGSSRERMVTITLPSDEGPRTGKLELPSGTVTLVGFPCAAKEEAR